MRHLRTDEILDRSGQLKVIVRTPNWDDFVHLVFSEIRGCGASNLQVARRLRAMIENLNETLPDHRQRELREQSTLLDLEIERLFRYPQERMLARLADFARVGRKFEQDQASRKTRGSARLSKIISAAPNQ